MQKTVKWSALVAVIVALSLGTGAQASDEWKFGIGTGLSSLTLDGDIGFTFPAGGSVIADVDLDNGDTSDMFSSAFGFNGYAAKGKWRLLYALGQLTLEDDDAAIDFEWDRNNAQFAAVYQFAMTGRAAWGAQFGVQYIGHDWTFENQADTERVEFDESWTDGVVGLTNNWPFADKWIWSNALTAGFGGSEDNTTFRSSVTRRFGDSWTASFNVSATSLDLEEDSLGEPGFYLYDVDETTVGFSFLYHW